MDADQLNQNNKKLNIMGQSKTKSWLEAIMNTFLGFFITLIVSPFVYWICDVEMSLPKMTAVTLLFTIISIIRNYVVRRFFNRLK